MPGGDLIAQGLRDLRAGSETIEALLVSMTASRLRAVGIDVPPAFPDAELRMYAQLTALHGDDAFGQYNALRRRIVSFARAAECAAR